MAGLSVTPSEAAAAGCSVSLDVAATESATSRYGTYTWTYYRARAVVASGWEFVRFEYARGGVTRTPLYTNPAPPEGMPTDLWPPLYDYVYQPKSGSAEYVNVEWVTAVFRKGAVQSSVTVKTSADPEDGGSATPTEETKTGDAGATVKFNLTATPKSGFDFVKWINKDTKEVVSTEPSVEVSLKVESTPKTYNYVAMFGNGLILYDASSGEILHGSGGAVLYSG